MIESNKSKSADFQESFVLLMTKEKENGFYVELGSGDPYEQSNTYLLENKYNWKGLPIEIDPKICDNYNLSTRINKAICHDALSFNYKKYFDENKFPKVIDFLQIDIDGHDFGKCLLALLALPMLEYRFTVIIIEHDLIQNYKRESMRNAQREILSSLGYFLVGQTPSEDWWIDPKYIDYSIYKDWLFVGKPPGFLIENYKNIHQ